MGESVKVTSLGCEGLKDDEFGLDLMEHEDDDVPLVEGVLIGIFGGDGELGTLVDGAVLTLISSFVRSMKIRFLMVILGFFEMFVEEHCVKAMDECEVRLKMVQCASKMVEVKGFLYSMLVVGFL
ncbi:hypothetical protein CTI12_AA413790 [Artemisia annua]|uniref:Uncharacterized protein n=1 Tax=Artemisia annua TaxID=35608 RepID=A0A2U1M6X0_ARTAN|nr:hypothetical protein CTI12_AA413790 [Artemisia annua]